MNDTSQPVAVTSKERLVREFQEFLDEKRDLDVSQAFHDIVQWVREHVHTPVPSSNQCAAYGCQNNRKNGQFVGDYCGPCDSALRYGTATFGTSFIFQQQREIERLKTELGTRPLVCVCEPLSAATRTIHIHSTPMGNHETAVHPA